MGRSRKTQRRAIQLICILMFAWSAAWAAVTGSISGTVKRPAGKSGAECRCDCAGGGNRDHPRDAQRCRRIFHACRFCRWAVMRWMCRPWDFETYQHKDIVLDTGAALTIDCALEVGAISQTVSVTDDALHVETVSTQSGEVISWTPDGGSTAERAQLYRSSLAPAGSGSLNDDRRGNRAGRGRDHPEPIGNAEPGQRFQ